MTCNKCRSTVNSLVIHDTDLWCWSCHNATKGITSPAPAVIPDSIPGGLEIRHGVCWPDGTPRKFYSKAAIRQAAFESGYFQGDDTPKSSNRYQEERHAADERRASQRGR